MPFSELEDNPELICGRGGQAAYSSILSGIGNSRNNLKRKRKPAQFNDNYIRKVAYRPFVQRIVTLDYIFIQMKGIKWIIIFPDSSSENRVICVPGTSGSKKVVFVTFMTKYNAGCPVNI